MCETEIPEERIFTLNLDLAVIKEKEAQKLRQLNYRKQK